MGYYLSVWQNYANFKGRARRKEYWLFTLFNTLAIFILCGIEIALFDKPFIFSALYFLAQFIPSLAVCVRRLHDTNKSGWWLLLSLIPFIGGLILFIFYCLDSQTGPNQYGDNPKGVIVD